MSGRVFSSRTGVLGLALLALLVVAALGPASALAAKKGPVVTKLSPASGWTTGGGTVVITGKHFKVKRKIAVTKVTFGAAEANIVRVKSSTSMTVVAPAGTGTVHVRVTSRAGTSARVRGDKYTYEVSPATQIALVAGNNQTASLGAAVAVKPSVIVWDSTGAPVAGVSVTFAVATGGGSVTGATALTNAAGIAAAGSWKLGTTAGANTLTATSEGLAGSPVTFTATGDPGILQVQQNGSVVRAYSLAEVEALPPFAGWAGLGKSPAIGPDAVTGVRVTDIIVDALGTPLAAGQTVDVKEVDSTPYNKVMTYDQLVNLAGFTYWDATTSLQILSPAGTLAAVLIYSDPDQNVMPVASGPLRFVVADATSENLVFKPTNLSVSKVNVLNVITP